MSLSLTSKDLRAVEYAQRVLLSPVAYPTAEEWRAEALSCVLALTGAGKGAFLATTPGDDRPMHTVGIDLPVLQDYASYYAERELLPPDPRPNVHYLRDVVSRAELHRAEIYSDFWKPNHQFDNLALTGVVEGVGFSGLFLHHDTERRTFGERGKALLRLLQPAFEEGLRTFGRWAGQQSELALLIDRMSEGLLLFDRTGRAVHANPALGKVFGTDREAGRVRDAIEALARELGGRLPSTKTAAPLPVAPSPRRVTTARATYRLSGTYVDETTFGGPAVLVSARRVGQELPGLASLRERFRLTKREAEVALLLARRKTNEEIAELLVVSPHTARGHTERVFQKLGVRSRRDVRETILED